MYTQQEEQDDLEFIISGIEAEEEEQRGIEAFIQHYTAMSIAESMMRVSL